MTGTLYQYKLSIVYELGKVILTEVQVITSGVLKGIIQLPKITNSSPLPIYNTYTTNIIKDSKSIKIRLPGMLVCPNKQVCWEPDMSRCVKYSHRVLCIYGDNFEENRYMRSIKNGSAEFCNFHIRSIHDPIVAQTRTGV